MRQPNVVWVMTDDQNWGSLGCGGNPQMQTPNIDAFYKDAVRMTDYHVGPTCAPTRSSLMTGRYANSTGVWHTVGGRSLLRADEWTIASAFSENGYKTGIFGKWHLGDTSPYLPQDRGFQKTVIHGGGGIGQTPDFWGNDYFDDTYMTDGKMVQYQGYCTDVFFSQAMGFIEQHKEEPFFCYIPTNAPHAPLNVPQEYTDRYNDLDIPENRKRYFGMVSCIDDNFGRLMQQLERLNLLDNTIVVFMTDNGTGRVTLTLDADSYVTEGYNGGLRGCKGSEYDGGHRVPFFMQYRGEGFIGGRDVDEITSCIDFMPTMLALCGIDAQEHNFHGKNIVPLLMGEGNHWEERVIVTDSQRLVYPQKWRKSSTMTTAWRLVNGVELYDAIQDKEQRCDVAWQHLDVVEQLRAAYEEWWNIVNVRFDEMIPQHIGEGKVTTFIPHDLRGMSNDYVYMQADVRSGKLAEGYWEVNVEQETTYVARLCRWPEEDARPICAGISDGDIDVAFDKIGVAENAFKNYQGGVALPIECAHLQIQGLDLYCDVTEEIEEVVFELPLQAGLCRMKAWFEGNQKRYPVYYLYLSCKQ